MVETHKAADSSKENGYEPLRIPLLDEETVWTQDAVTVAGGKRWGNDLSHLNFPSGIYIDDDETIYIADYSNNRIMEWKSGATTGQVVAGVGQPGDRSERLNNPKEVILDKATDSFIISDEGHRRVVQWPRQPGSTLKVLVSNIDPAGIAIDHDRNLYVVDHKKHEVKRYKMDEKDTGMVVAGGNGKGTRANQLSHPTCIFVDKEQAVYVSDWGNHRISKWEKGAKKGIIVAGADTKYHEKTSLSDPFGLVVDDDETLYIVDWLRHRIMRWPKGDKNGTIIIGTGTDGREPNQLNHPMCLAFDRKGNIYVSDFSNHRIQKFNINLEPVKH